MINRNSQVIKMENHLKMPLKIILESIKYFTFLFGNFIFIISEHVKR